MALAQHKIPETLIKYMDEQGNTTNEGIVSFWFARLYNGNCSLTNEPRGRPEL